MTRPQTEAAKQRRRPAGNGASPPTAEAREGLFDLPVYWQQQIAEKPGDSTQSIRMLLGREWTDAEILEIIKAKSKGVGAPFVGTTEGAILAAIAGVRADLERDIEASRPAALRGDLANLPAALTPLQALSNWVTWRYEWKPGKSGGRWTKPPYNPRRPKSYASNTDPSTWGTYAEALAAFQKGGFDGIGINLLGSGLGMFDIDNCCDAATGTTAPEAIAIIKRANSYAELTPSGTGVRVIGYGAGNEVHRKQRLPTSVVEIETYRGARRYVTVTGLALAENILVNIDAAIDETVASLDAANNTTKGKAALGLDEWIEQHGDRYEHDDDFADIDGNTLPPKLLELLRNNPPADDLSKAFHHAVCWMGNDLKWSPRKIRNDIESSAVVPARYEDRLFQEVCRCLCNSDNKKAGGGSDNPEINRLARMTREEYEKARKQSAKDMGFRVSVLDSMVADARGGADAATADKEIERINADHALVLAGNRSGVMRFDTPTKFRVLQVGAFKNWFANQLVQVGKDLMALGDYWMSHQERRQYSGIEFAPTGTALPDGFYNLWQGFAVKPSKGSCDKFLDHVWDNVARGDEEAFNWIIGWWAQIFQQPSIKMETALCLRGPQGTGKSKVGEVMGSLIGSAHHLAVNAPRYITGQFNSHMASLLVLQCEEAFWAGDKAAEGTLKDLVSGKTHMLEYKGIDPIWIRNFIRLFVTSNSGWIVPAGLRDRRWAIFDIGEGNIQDTAYFAAIDEEMDNGGREALLHYLLEFDLKQVDLRKIPRTAALFDQQIEGMDSEQAWWFETLMRGALPSKPHDVEDDRTVLKDDLYETYFLHARLRGIVRRSIETKVGMFLVKQLGATLEHPRPFVGKPPTQLRCYKLPPLKECRERFAMQLGHPVEWGDGWETAEWLQNDSFRDALAKAVGNRRGSLFY